MKTFKEFLNEAKYKVYISDSTFWFAYAEGSGRAYPLSGLGSFVTSKPGDSHYNEFAQFAADNLKSIKPLKKQKNQELYQIPVYKGETDLDIWTGVVRPNSPDIYLILTREANIVITFFNSKTEAMSWLRTSE